jgi:acyl carrier protein
VNTSAEFSLAKDLTEEVCRMTNGTRPIECVIEPDTDLLATGILDSMALVDLLNFIETKYGCRVNLLDADPAQFSTIRGLCELAAKQDS